MIIPAKLHCGKTQMTSLNTEKKSQRIGWKMSRRHFLQSTGTVALLALVAPPGLADATKTTPTDNKEKLLDSSAMTLAKAIRARQVSSEEVVHAFLQRIEQVNPQLNAVVQLRAEAALTEARAADKALAAGKLHGPLHGI